MKKENLIIKNKNIELTNYLFNEFKIEVNAVNTYENKYLITFKNIRTQEKASFDFTDSIYNLENNIHLNLLDVLACILSLDYNAVDGVNFDDFCWCFGYDNDSIKALDIYRQCLENKEKVDRVFSGCPNKLYSISVRKQIIKKYNLDNY